MASGLQFITAGRLEGFLEELPAWLVGLTYNLWYQFIQPYIHQLSSCLSGHREGRLVVK